MHRTGWGRVADNVKQVVEEQQMSISVRRKNAEPRRADDKEARNQKEDSWEDRRRLVGDARFVEVEWSKRDNPSWPLPIK
jgi:hypothetical protein